MIYPKTMVASPRRQQMLQLSFRDDYIDNNSYQGSNQKENNATEPADGLRKLNVCRVMELNKSAD